MPKEIESEWLDARPRIVVSRCLGFDACRWNGEMIRDAFVESLKPHVNFVTLCPECEIGLGVPRRPIRLVAPDGSPRKEPVEMQSVQLVQPASGLNVTQDMHDTSIAMLDCTDPPDGFLLKHRSPSCGPLDVRIYRSADDSNVAGKGAGLFAWNVSRQYPNLPIEDEGRLRNVQLESASLLVGDNEPDRLDLLLPYPDVFCSAGWPDKSPGRFDTGGSLSDSEELVESSRLPLEIADRSRDEAPVG